MKQLLAVPKRILRALWRVIRTIGEVLYLIIKLVFWPILFLWRLFD